MKIECSYKRKQKFKPSGSVLRCKNDSMKVLHKINILKRNMRSNCIITARNSEMGFYEPPSPPPLHNRYSNISLQARPPAEPCMAI